MNAFAAALEKNLLISELPEEIQELLDGRCYVDADELVVECDSPGDIMNRQHDTGIHLWKAAQRTKSALKRVSYRCGDKKMGMTLKDLTERIRSINGDK